MMNFEVGPHIGEVLEIGLVGLVLIIYSICSAYKHKKSCEAGACKTAHGIRTRLGEQ